MPRQDVFVNSFLGRRLTENLYARAPAPAMLPTNLAFALLELFPQFPQPLGIFEDIGDALLLFRVRLAARLGLLGFGRFNTAVLDATVQLVHGQAGRGASRRQRRRDRRRRCPRPQGWPCRPSRDAGPPAAIPTNRGISARCMSKRSASRMRGSQAFT